MFSMLASSAVERGFEPRSDQTKDCLTPTQQQFQQVNFQWDDDEVRFVLDQNPELEFFIVLAHWNNSLQIYMSLYSNTLSWFWVNQSLLFLLNAYVCFCYCNNFYKIWNK
jgi:hypothetical protein